MATKLNVKAKKHAATEVQVSGFFDASNINFLHAASTALGRAVYTGNTASGSLPDKLRVYLATVFGTRKLDGKRITANAEAVWQLFHSHGDDAKELVNWLKYEKNARANVDGLTVDENIDKTVENVRHIIAALAKDISAARRAEDLAAKSAVASLKAEAEAEKAHAAMCAKAVVEEKFSQKRKGTDLNALLAAEAQQEALREEAKRHFRDPIVHQIILAAPKRVEVEIVDAEIISVDPAPTMLALPAPTQTAKRARKTTPRTAKSKAKA